jgi:hypothetical protein
VSSTITGRSDRQLERTAGRGHRTVGPPSGASARRSEASRDRRIRLSFGAVASASRAPASPARSLDPRRARSTAGLRAPRPALPRSCMNALPAFLFVHSSSRPVALAGGWSTLAIDRLPRPAARGYLNRSWAARPTGGAASPSASRRRVDRHASPAIATERPRGAARRGRFLAFGGMYTPGGLTARAETSLPSTASDHEQRRAVER